ncbi:hypothetical protein AOLI_G00150140 [Acnodon oligacanthus]
MDAVILKRRQYFLVPMRVHCQECFTLVRPTSCYWSSVNASSETTTKVKHSVCIGDLLEMLIVVLFQIARCQIYPVFQWPLHFAQERPVTKTETHWHTNWLLSKWYSKDQNIFPVPWQTTFNKPLDGLAMGATRPTEKQIQ